MKAQPTLVWANSAIEFNAVAFIYVNITLIVSPWHPEHNGTFWFHDTFKQAFAFVFWIFFNERNNRFCYFLNGLHKFRLIWICCLDLCNESVDLSLVLARHMSVYIDRFHRQMYYKTTRLHTCATQFYEHTYPGQFSPIHPASTSNPTL